MKNIFLFIILLIANITLAQKRDYSIQSVSFTKVKLTDKFWLPRIETNRMVTIPASFERCDKTGRVKNFIMAATHTGKFCSIYPFDDTDIYKTIEGASYSISLFPDPAMSAYLDSLITIIGKAQEPDGYLYTARSIDPAHPFSWAGSERWINERQLSHELYNAGHLYEAAAAHYLATGKKNLLNIALKNADLVCSVFGTSPNQKHTAPGHEVIEMGLVKLYRITGKKEYLQTAKYFIEERGHDVQYDSTSKDEWKNGAYWQDNIPVVDQTEAEGHAVRAGYLYSAMADVAALTGDSLLENAIDKIWNNVVYKKIYVQGGVGAIGDGERFGDNYELPNATAYNETCAAIALVYWNYRMFLLHGEAKYMDVLEKSLYNGLISGVGLDGKSFFYTNAMQVQNSFSPADMEATRSGWFECSCCPTNLARLIPSIPGYMYAQKADSLYINLFISSQAELVFHQKKIQVIQKNNYPWDGGLLFMVNPESSTFFHMLLRIPGWARNQAIPSTLYQFQQSSDLKPVIKVNGVAVDYTIENGYASISRTWKKNDQVEVLLPMEIRKVAANQNITDDIGKIALQRGPLIYCAEWVDNHGKTDNIILPASTKFSSEYLPDLLNGVTVLKSNASAVVIENSETISTVMKAFTAIPYYSWANRGRGEMMVWFPIQVKAIDIQAN